MKSKQQVQPAKVKLLNFKLTKDITSFNLQALILIIIGFIFYTNSFWNEYALDDGIVIEHNEYVQKGIKGIGKILSTDAYDSFYKQMNAGQQLAGGRYRPLSIVTFAIEQQFFGDKTNPSTTDLATLRHVVNVFLYLLSVIVLLFFLRTYLFEEKPLTAFAVALLFLIHPIHTEVVANVKSRDEILSFLFILLTFIKVFQYDTTKQKRYLYYGLLYYFLALLSKEYAITLIVLIPLLLYIKRKQSLKEGLAAVIPYFVIAVIYMLIRFSIVGKGATVADQDVLNDPFKFTTPIEKWATKIEILNHYLRLLFNPSTLSSDYSYQTIPYTNFYDPAVWISLIVHVIMVGIMFILFFKRNILSFALAFYLIHLMLVSNLIVDIGATMGERLIYHSSFGFCMVLGIIIMELLQKLKQKAAANSTGAIIAVIIVIWCGKITIARNAEWKNDSTLFIADAQKVSNSVLVNGNAGKAYIDLSEKPENKDREQELILKSIPYFQRAIRLHERYVNGYLNIGVAYFKLKDYPQAQEYWEKARIIYPNNPFVKRNMELLGQVYYNEAMKFGAADPAKAITFLKKAIEADSNNANYWYDLGGANYTIKDFTEAKNAWNKAVELNPNHEQAKQGLNALDSEGVK